MYISRRKLNDFLAAAAFLVVVLALVGGVVWYFQANAASCQACKDDYKARAAANDPTLGIGDVCMC